MNRFYETPPSSIRGGPLSISTTTSTSGSIGRARSGSSKVNPRDGAFPISPRATYSRSRRLSSPIALVSRPDTPPRRPPTPPMSPSNNNNNHPNGVCTVPDTPISPTPFSPSIPLHRDMFSPPRQRHRAHRRSMSLYSESTRTDIRTDIRNETLPLVETKEDPGDVFEREMHAKMLSFHTREAMTNIEMRKFKAAEPSIRAVLKLLPKTAPATGEEVKSRSTMQDEDPAASREKWLRHLLDAQSSQNRWIEVISTLQELIVITSAEGGDGAKTAGLHYLLADAYFRSAASPRKSSKQKAAYLGMAESHCRTAMKIAYGIPEMKGGWKDPLKLIAKVCAVKGDVADAKFYRSLLREEGVDLGVDDDLFDDGTFMRWLGADLSVAQWLQSPFAHMETTDYVLLSIFVGLVGVFGFTVTKCICS